MSMLSEAMSALRGAQAACFGETVSYIDGDGRETEVRAVPGSTVFRQRNEYGMWIRTETRDFIVTKSQLPKDPVKGDVIMWNGGEYEVLAPNDEPVWRWSDPLETAYRIHTKHTGGFTDGE